MTDRELLEAAAKAAGVEIADDNIDTPIVSILSVGGGWWNPLDDDRDAFRLAVKLGLSVDQDFDRIDVYRQGDLLACEYLYQQPEPTDPYAATRRAIVRAAAAMAAPSKEDK